MLRFPPAAVLLLVLVSYSTLWSAMRGESDFQDDLEGSGNSSQCMPCELGTEPDYESGYCNCSSCNCSLLNPTHNSAPTSLPFSRYTRQHCNCSGFCENANSSCSQCQAGYYADARGLARCKMCVEGSYTDDLGSHKCLLCLAGQYQPSPGGTQCEECSAGTYANKPGAARCKNCSTGTYSNTTGSSACRHCSDGHYIDVPAATSCLVCRNGTYTNSSSGYSSCRTCEPGRYCNKSGCGNCTACPPGYSTRDPDRCHICQAGTFTSNPGSTRCIDCGKGTVCRKFGCSQCSACPLGQQPSNGNSLFDCEQCIPGRFRGERSGYFCEDCSSGYYQVDSGQSQCIICPTGHYCPYSSAEPRACPEDAKCPRGSVQPLFCKNFFAYSSTEEQCVPKPIFYITITLVILFAVLVITLISCTVYWNFLRKKTSTYEKLPLSRHIKKQPVSEPIYSGH